MEKDYSKDMDANLKRRQEIYEEIENLTFDPSLPVLESYQDYCKRYAQLRDEMLQLHSLLPKETRLQCMRRTTNQWLGRTVRSGCFGWVSLLVFLQLYRELMNFQAHIQNWGLCILSLACR